MRTPEQQALIDAQRASIKVTSVIGDQGQQEQVDNQEAKEDIKAAEVEEEVKEEVKEEETKTEEVEEGKEEVIEAKEALEENKEELDEAKQEKKDAKTPAEKDRAQRRIDRLTAKNAEITKALEAANAKIAELVNGNEDDGTPKLTEADVEARAEQKANEKALHRELVNAGNAIYDAAVGVNKDFEVKVKEMIGEIGVIPGQIIGVVNDLPNKGDVMYHIADDIDLAEKLYDLSRTNLAKLGRELQKISDTLAKPKPKEVSKAPKPPAPVGTARPQAGATNLYNTKNVDAKDWINKRQAEVNKKLAEKYITR